MQKNDAQTWVATCANGLEALLAAELQSMGGTVVENAAGAVTVEADELFGYRACLQSRFAERILLPLIRFHARMPDDVYNACRKLPWRDHLAVWNSFAITSVISPDVGHSANFVTMRLKDAVVDALRNANGERPDIDSRRPDLPLHLFWKGEDVQVSIDFAGQPLHRRGYREEAGEAPLKETLAAAILAFAGWPRAEAPLLVDPFCGSGTLLIEGMSMALGIAPGLDRDYFGFLGWRRVRHDAWKRLRDEALAHRESVLQTSPVRAVGYDADRDMVALARDNAKHAGLERLIHVERRELAQVDRRHLPESGGMVVTNPPFGERLADRETVPLLYQALGRTLSEGCSGWRAAVLAAHIEDADRIPLESPEVHRLYNGPLRVYLRTGVVRSMPPRIVRLPEWREAPDVVPDLANRLAKNLRKLRKWIDTERVECLRLYDADMPEYNFALDWYNGDIHLQEYAPPKTVDPDKARARLDAAAKTVSAVFGVPPRHVHVKSRERQKGSRQYQKLDDRQHFVEVVEGAARFQVNFRDYLDTGLFLDHRPTRLRLESLARGKRFLNLFCYTGAATVHAGVGGCRSSVSVDSSRTYLAWAARNLALNGLSEGQHRLVQADCRRWLRDTREQFDLIFMDPPTFSNAKAREDFDIQRDHVDLIDAAMRRLERDGLLIFSNNFKRFQLDDEALSLYAVTDITVASLPPDFDPKAPIHRCWEIRHLPKP
jgi:23S rRNA (guanine2445-N2)-methyltransferase / 23S rRNA (guanine2069-N7)-methyltransferase